MSQQISIPDKGTVTTFLEMGDVFAKSGMFGCRNKESGMVLAMTCFFEKKSPVEVTKRYHIINGKLSMKTDAMLAEFNKLGGVHEILKRDSEVSSVKLSLDGRSTTFTVTWEELQKEPFTKSKSGEVADNYATPRKRMQMMWAKVISDGLRAFCPAVNYGEYTPEEISDFGDDEPSETITHPGPKTGELLPAEATTKFVDTHNASVECPVTQVELSEIVGLIKEIQPNQPDIKDKIVAMIQPRKLNDLSQAESVKLIETLKNLAAKLRLAGQ